MKEIYSNKYLKNCYEVLRILFKSLKIKPNRQNQGQPIVFKIDIRAKLIN